jgi:hypothetical protein
MVIGKSSNRAGINNVVFEHECFSAVGERFDGLLATYNQFLN